MKNLRKNRQIIRNHRAKIRWSSKTKTVNKRSVTRKIRLPEPVLDTSGLWPVPSHVSARLSRPKVSRKETA